MPSYTQYCTKAEQFKLANGGINASGTISTFQSGTSTPLNCYTDASGGGAATSQTFDTNGRANIFLTHGTAYRILIKDSGGNTVAGPIDNVYGNLVTSSSLSAGSLLLSAISTGPTNVMAGRDPAGVGSVITPGTALAFGSNTLSAVAGTYPRLAYGTATGSATTPLTFDSTVITTTYNTYILVLSDNSKYSSGTWAGLFQLSSDGGSNWHTTSGDYLLGNSRTNNTMGVGGADPANSTAIGVFDHSTITGESSHVIAIFKNVSSSGIKTTCWLSNHNNYGGTGTYRDERYIGQRTVAEVNNGLRMIYNNITSWTIYYELYGVAD